MSTNPVLYPTAFHSNTHCIVCGATYETCVCGEPKDSDPDDDNSWDLDTYDGMYDNEEMYAIKG